MKYVYSAQNPVERIYQKSLFLQSTLVLICLLLLALWIIVSIDRYDHFDLFNANMQALPFTSWVNSLLALLVAALETVAACLLLWPQSRAFGLWLSLLLLSCYTLYVGLVLSRLFGTIPCTCASPIPGLSWTQHFFFNLSASGIAAAGVYLETRSKQQAG